MERDERYDVWVLLCDDASLDVVMRVGGCGIRYSPTSQLESVEADRDEWRKQHEILLDNWRAEERRRIAAERKRHELEAEVMRERSNVLALKEQLVSERKLVRDLQFRFGGE